MAVWIIIHNQVYVWIAFIGPLPEISHDFRRNCLAGRDQQGSERKVPKFCWTWWKVHAKYFWSRNLSHYLWDESLFNTSRSNQYYRKHPLWNCKIRNPSDSDLCRKRFWLPIAAFSDSCSHRRKHSDSKFHYLQFKYQVLQLVGQLKYRSRKRRI